MHNQSHCSFGRLTIVGAHDDIGGERRELNARSIYFRPSTPANLPNGEEKIAHRMSMLWCSTSRSSQIQSEITLRNWIRLVFHYLCRARWVWCDSNIVCIFPVRFSARFRSTGNYCLMNCQFVWKFIQFPNIMDIRIQWSRNDGWWKFCQNSISKNELVVYKPWIIRRKFEVEYELGLWHAEAINQKWTSEPP